MYSRKSAGSIVNYVSSLTFRVFLQTFLVDSKGETFYYNNLVNVLSSFSCKVSINTVFLTQILSRRQKNADAKKCIIDFTSAKMEFASAKGIFPNIQLKDVVNRLAPFKNLYDHTNSFLMG